MFEQRLAQATALADYLFAELRARVDLNTLAGRARLAELARPLLEKLPDGHYRDLMVGRLRQEAGLEATRLRPPPAAATASRADRNLRLIRTPLRKAIALLLYRPELALQAAGDVVPPPDSGEPGMHLLAELLGTLRSQPRLGIATLLERYRDTREGLILARLATWEPEVSEQDYQFEEEFADILAYLHRRRDPREQLPDILLRRGTPRALSDTEREVLRNLGKSLKK
jgi:DNA primase